MIEFFEELISLNTVTQLNENFKLIFLCKVSHIDLTFIDLKLTLPLNGINDHVLIELPFVLCLNMQFKNVGRRFLIDNPQEELQTSIEVFSIYRVRIRLDRLVTISITMGGRLRF